jgi:hypothetical protein
MDPARMFEESLTSSLELENSHGHLRLIDPACYLMSASVQKRPKRCFATK